VVLLYFLVLNTGHLLLFLAGALELLRFRRRRFSGDARQIERSEMTWPVSVIVPAREAGETIVETVRSLRMLSYRELEIVVVNDGSTDGTLAALTEAFGLRRLDRVYRRSVTTGEVRGIYGSLEVPNLLVVDKARGGRADALNAGINLSRYPLICPVESGTVLEDDALLQVVRPFLQQPEETVAVSGLFRQADAREAGERGPASLGLPDRSLPLLQVVESLRSSVGEGLGCSALRMLPTFPCGFGLYRKREVVAVGGFPRDSEAVELELSLRLHEHLGRRRKPYRVVLVPEPVCRRILARRPGELLRARVSRQRGFLRALWTHRRLLLHPRQGRLGLVAYPWLTLFRGLGPAVETLGWLLLPLGWAVGLVDSLLLLLFLTVAVLYPAFLSAAAVLLDETAFRHHPRRADLWKLLAFAALENLGYRQLLSLLRARALLAFVSGSRGGGEEEPEGYRPASQKA
jgi:cellulose synthase/poly-beta-1,6-N-acetylglucosamine synthase-like glycosyltransferase